MSGSSGPNAEAVVPVLAGGREVRGTFCATLSGGDADGGKPGSRRFVLGALRAGALSLAGVLGVLRAMVWSWDDLCFSIVTAREC